MDREALELLVGVYDTLYSVTVTGDAIIPMAQALVMLNGVIGTAVEEIKKADATAETVRNLNKSENMEEVSI